MTTQRMAVMFKVIQRLLMLGGACVLAVAPGAAAGAALARLTSVSTLASGGAVTFVIEATEPVPFATARPNPLTLVIDLRHVTAAGVSSSIGRTLGPIADVVVQDARADDGAAVARVRFTLSEPVEPTVRSRRNAVLVEFPAPAAAPVPAGRRAAPDARAALKPVVSNPQPPTTAGLALRKIDITETPVGTRVTLAGSGPLPPTTVVPTSDGPPRLIIDLKGVSTTTQSADSAAQGPVARVRAAQNSRDPLVTRVVIDLREKASFRVEYVGGQISLVVRPADAVAPAAAPSTPLMPAPTVTGADMPKPAAAEAPKAVVVTPKPAAPAAPKPVVEAPKPAAAEAPKPVVATPKPAAAEAPTPVVEPPKPAAAEVPKTVVETPKPAAAEAPKPVVETPKPAAADAPKPTEPKPPADVAKPAAPEPAKAGRASEQVAGAQVPSGRTYSGRPVSFDFTGADLRAVLRTFAEPEISGLNVVIDPIITGTVDVSLREVPWDQALEIILRANKLGYAIENNVVRISTLKALAEEEAERRKLSEEQAMSGQLKVLTRSLSYAKAADLTELLKKSVLSQRGEIQVDPRTNTIIITDLASRLEDAEDLMSRLDQPEPQVEIEARIVQTTRESARALGVQWGMNGRMASELGNTSPLTFPAQGGVSGRTGAVQNSPVGAVRSDSPTAVNLGVTGATTAVGLAMGTLNGAFNLDVALSALERKGHGKTLSTPRVTMQNNVEAEMMQGIQIPIQTVSNNTITVTFKDAALLLKVKPQITASNTVIMDVFLENATPDYSRQVNGIPPIDTQRAKTQVLVQDGDTTVIGGIVVAKETVANDKVPMLHKVPLLGWLFKRDSFLDDNRELLIFITPKIRR